MSVTTLAIPLRTTTQRWSLPLLTVFVLWVLLLFEPHIWIAKSILGPIPKFIYLALAIMIVLQAPGRVWYLPFLTLIAGGLIASGFAENIGYAQNAIIKILLLYYILAIGSLTFIKSIDKTTLLLQVFLWQFLWWGFHGSLAGRVPWHPDLGNEDSFGPMMVIGMGYSFYFGMATRKRTLRLMAFFLSVLCVAGLVSSFARGAVLGAGVVLAYVLWRSPQKGRTFAAALLGLGVFVFFVNILFPSGFFWQEMSTISGGFETGTGLDRWILWKTAWREFVENPIFGVGGENFGVYASKHLWLDPELIDKYDSAGRLWGRTVHSLYFQLLSEFGLVGTIAFVALLVDFWKRNKQLRSAPLITGWLSATRHRFDLRMLSLALEAAMIGFLATGFFYNQLYVNWFYSVLVMNRLLHSSAVSIVTKQPPPLSS